MRQVQVSRVVTAVCQYFKTVALALAIGDRHRTPTSPCCNDSEEKTKINWSGSD
jgi:hypothetical protein